MTRFTLEPRRWYACELIGDEFTEDKCSYSPIKVHQVKPAKTGNRTFALEFYHANYPEGVRDKVYQLQTIERGRSLLLAKSLEHNPPRFLQIYEITAEWVSRHFRDTHPDPQDIQGWLNKNA
jgi:hypothetical protein